MQMMTKRAPDGAKNGIMGLTCNALFCSCRPESSLFHLSAVQSNKDGFSLMCGPVLSGQLCAKLIYAPDYFIAAHSTPIHSQRLHLISFLSLKFPI